MQLNMSFDKYCFNFAADEIFFNVLSMNFHFVHCLHLLCFEINGRLTDHDYGAPGDSFFHNFHKLWAGGFKNLVLENIIFPSGICHSRVLMNMFTKNLKYSEDEFLDKEKTMKHYVVNHDFSPINAHLSTFYTIWNFYCMLSL